MTLFSKFRNIDSVALKKIDQICSFPQGGMAASLRLWGKIGVSHYCNWVLSANPGLDHPI